MPSVRRFEGVRSEEGVSPYPENFWHFYFKMVSFCACLHGFLFGIFYSSELCHRQLLTIYRRDDINMQWFSVYLGYVNLHSTQSQLKTILRQP